MQTIADGLNLNSNTTNASFNIISSTESSTTWRMSCHSNYVWKQCNTNSFDAPASNNSITHSEARGVAAVVISHNNSEVSTLTESSLYTQNAYHFAAAGITFIAGCWPEN